MICEHYQHWMFCIHPDDKTKRVRCRLCENSPHFDRFKVTQMVCLFCSCVQPVGSACVNPECTAGGISHRYYCNTCHLWENNASRTLFHCDECGICRVGDPHMYRHCSQCGMCVPTKKTIASYKPEHILSGAMNLPYTDSHHCIGGQLKENPCPICYEDMVESSESAVFLPCGHAVHALCLDDLYTQGSGRCPLCPQNPYMSS